MNMIIVLIIFQKMMFIQMLTFRLKPTHSDQGGISVFMEFKCKPGEIFKQDCERCTCDEDTRREVICKYTHCRKSQPCIPLQSFKKGCSPCTCQLDGVSFCKLIKCRKRIGRKGCTVENGRKHKSKRCHGRVHH